MSIVFCLICDEMVSSEHRFKHTLDEHGLSIDDTVEYNVYGTHKCQLKIETSYSGCPYCDTYAHMEIMAITSDGLITTSTVRCFECDGVYFQIDPAHSNDAGIQRIGDMLKKAKSSVRKIGKCSKCKKLTYDKNDESHYCIGYFAQKTKIEERLLDKLEECDGYADK